MSADWNTPVLGTAYVDVLTNLKDRDVDALTLCIVDPTNIPANAIKYNRASDKFQEYVAAVWTDRILSLAGGGTGSATAAGARTNLGLGTMAVQDGNNVNITGGTIGGATAIDAARLTSGLVAQARLGSGSGGAGNNFLADDQTYKPAVSVLTGSGMLWYTNAAPSGYLMCDGSAVSRSTYSALFAVIGIVFGAGDGSTTFNLPDLRQRFPLGKSASGTGNTLAGTGGAIDHTHTSAAHIHTMGNHTHSAGSYTQPGHTHNIDVGTASITVGGTVEVVLGSGTNVISSNTGGNHSHNFASANSGSGGADAITGTSGTPSTNNSDSTTPGATGSNNAPYLVVNYIIKT